MMGDEKSDWKSIATKIQKDYFTIFAPRRYDEIKKSEDFHLKKKVGFATCGKPSDIPKGVNDYTGYKKEQLNCINKICDQILKKSDVDPIRFACTILVVHSGNETSQTSIFRIVTSSGNIFIDANARVYIDWEQFMLNNKLPDCEYCFPVNGDYYTADHKVAFAYSPASSVLGKTIECADVAGSVAALGGSAVFLTSCAVTVGPAALTAAGTAAICTGVYSVGRSIVSLRDRSKHEQSIGLGEMESRAAWFAIFTSTVNFAKLGALARAKQIAKSGKSLGNLTGYTMHSLNVASVVFSGFGFFDCLWSSVNKYKKGSLTKKDVFDLTCQWIFFFNSLASFKATTEFIDSVSETSKESILIKENKTETQNTDNLEDSICLSEENINSLIIQSLCFDTIKYYYPEQEQVLYTIQGIGYDIMRWKLKKISLTDLIIQIAPRIFHLLKVFKNSIKYSENRVIGFIKCLIGEVLEWFDKFQNADKKDKAVITYKVVDMNNEIGTMINEAEKDINQSHEQIKSERAAIGGINRESVNDGDVASEQNIEINGDDPYENNIEFVDGSNEDNAGNVNDSNEDNAENVDDSNEDNTDNNMDDINEGNIGPNRQQCLNPETQRLLSRSGNLIASISYNDIGDFGDILDGMKHFVVNEFKEKISNYKNSLEAAKFASNSFDIDLFHAFIGIRGDVTQHYYNETINALGRDSCIYKIKEKCKQFKRKREGKSTNPSWHLVEDDTYVYYGPNGASGHLSKEQLLSLVGQILDKDLNENNCVCTEEQSDTILIDVNCGPNDAAMQIVISHQLDEENTDFGLIIVYK